MLRSPLLHFLLIGALLFAVQSVAVRPPAETPRIEVQQSEIDERIAAYQQQMGRTPSPEEAKAIENQVIENALWLEEAYAIGIHEVDSVIRQRLLLNMRFLEGEPSGSPGVSGSASENTFEQEEALLARAIELGMDRSDTVVQRRLVDRVQAILRAGVRAQSISDETLAAHFAETQEKWREPPLLDLSHVYFSRDKRGAEATEDAASALQNLGAKAPSESGLSEDALRAALSLGDPFLSGHRLKGATPNRIIARLGPDFASGVADATSGQWIGPVASAFGQHLVFIHTRTESRIPDLDEIQTRVTEDWIEQESRRVLNEHIKRRRSEVDVAIVGQDNTAASPDS